MSATTATIGRLLLMVTMRITSTSTTMATLILRTTTIVRTGSRSVASKHHPEDHLLTDLFTAYYCARQNKRNTASQVRFERNLTDNLIGLYNEVREFRYEVGRSMCFIIHDPVRREVFAAAFRDRIIHHLLYNWLMPVFEPTFIYDSYSCRVGKGTLFGIKRLEHHIRSCSNNFTKPTYVLKMDIEGYFMNINRSKLYDFIKKRLDDPNIQQSLSFDNKQALYLLKQIIFNDPVKGCYRKGRISDWDGLPDSKSLFHSPQGCGLPIGNLTSQLFSNVYLSSLDNYVKRTLKCRHYGRYVDDFYIVSNAKDELMPLVSKIRRFLIEELGLSLHPRKVCLYVTEKGVPFLGAVIKPYQRYVSSRTRKGSFKRMENLWIHEENPYMVQSAVQSYMGYYRHFSGKCKILKI